MSEHQYYEFQAIDRPLTGEEMQKLRTYSTRARITPTTFVNHYEWGSFKGDEDVWMEKYFDAFLYFANWGTHVLKIRLPSNLSPLETARQYCPGGPASVRKKAGKAILTFVSEDEEGEEDWDGDEGRLASLIPVRAELSRGDRRALYLGWLLCAQSGDLDGDDLEPAVPPGLGRLSASLLSLADFLRIDADLFDAASASSANAAEETPNRESLARWVTTLPSREKDGMLVRLMKDEGTHLANELLARFRRQQHSQGQGGGESEGQVRRTVAELLQAAEERRHIAAMKTAEEKARRERAAMAARAKYLSGLVGRETTLWGTAEQLIATKQPKSYDRAMELLIDLRALATRKGGSDFQQRLEALRAAHARKLTLMERLKKAGL
jgi:hypothetical protein